ncbi:AAA domain (dynein-related subfamily) [Gemmata obscuriglobus]|uniref:AAA family ATPase n=1 Tax=Gemmata obscuriglobus TaxID=114 RepID=A0A2Z3H757_9BACT|nr:AAA family ATPase [Gemmata obscuriglobus]AWM41863.1 AAA family ATPase [Gemmata obscuriglobus]QEG32168.1 AAA domain (dynein-related subfamily) [Gemmata obscuriglobus]VTS11521.1 atpase aaa : ATPase AAA OS=Cystobacter violaceus Cb vi76 GN=Q664_20165 PE=4 SV=1: AAA_5 [Gemmata obscuriglobus UQM 2246]
MAKKPVPAAPTPALATAAGPAPTVTPDTVLREPAERRYADQLEALRQNDADTPPANWKLSPRAVLAYIVGTPKPLKATINGKAVEVPITRKFFGDDGIVERSIVTLASERALLLVGEPGTGKSWLSEHLAAAICGTSLLTIQGTAGTTEEQIKYSWNIAQLIAHGYSPQNMVPSPAVIAMRAGALFRFEELSRVVPDVQDALVSMLSDKAVAVPELPDNAMVFAKPGFNIIATANTRDQGVNELSAALKRRFNYVHIPIVGDQKTEVKIVQQRSAELLERYNLPAKLSPPVIELLATVFREIRNGKSSDGVSIKKPSTTLSTAEAIGVALDAALHARFFGAGEVGPADIARNMIGAVVKEDQDDKNALKEYATVVAKKRGAKEKAWKEFHDALVEQL